MRLLFDENLPPVLVQVLHAEYAGLVHVRDVGLSAAQDDEIWRYAQKHNCIIVYKDSDFRQRSFLFGQPPKVVVVGLLNCYREAVEKLLRPRRAEVDKLATEVNSAFLMLT